MLRYFARGLSGLLLSLALSAGANATDWPAVEARVKKMASSSEFVETVLDQYKFQGTTRAVMRVHLRHLYGSDEVIKALVAEMRNFGADGNAPSYGESAASFGQKFGAELFQAWAIKGLARLSSPDQRSFYRYLLKWMTVATPADCKQMMFSDDKSALESGLLEIKYFSRLSQGELEAYLGLLRKAIFAELRDFPYSKTLNGEQLEIADLAFQARLEETIKNENISLDVLAAMTDMQTATPKGACDAGKLIFRTLLGMKGIAGDWMVLKMVLAGQ